jgi:hypothetical protein
MVGALAGVGIRWRQVSSQQQHAQKNNPAPAALLEETGKPRRSDFSLNLPTFCLFVC